MPRVPAEPLRRLLEVLGLYKPVVWEYSRLNITNNVMSKRKLNKLVMGGFVNGWDDPRLMTLAGGSHHHGMGCVMHGWGRWNARRVDVKSGFHRTVVWA